MSEQPQLPTSDTSQIVATRGDAATEARQLFDRWLMVIMHPVQFFEHEPLPEGFVMPMLFVQCMSLFSATGCLSLWFANPDTTIFLFGNPTTCALLCLTGAIPLSFVRTGTIWLLSKLFGGVGSFEQTYQVCCYSEATLVLALVPGAGSVANLWSLFLLSLGVKRVHQLSLGKATTLVLLPGLIWYVGFFAMLPVLLSHLR